MDVVNLHNASGDDTKINASVVTDDLIALASNSKGVFYIYIVFRKRYKLTAPLYLVYFDREQDITRRDADEVTKRSMDMWIPRSRHAAPNENRLAGDALKLNFYKERSGSVFYSWTDIPANHYGREPRSSVVSTIRPVANLEKYNLYLVLPFGINREDVLVLSQKAYITYLSCGERVKRIGLECPILSEYDGFSFMNFRCGHFICHKCFRNMEPREEKNKTKKYDFCPVCNFRVEDEKKDIIRAKLRHGPCPVDGCLEDSDNLNGVILRPCGCYIHCQALEDAVKTKPNERTAAHREIIAFVDRCPYDACRRRIDSIDNVYRR